MTTKTFEEALAALEELAGLTTDAPVTRTARGLAVRIEATEHGRKAIATILVEGSAPTPTQFVVTVITTPWSDPIGALATARALGRAARAAYVLETYVRDCVRMAP